MQCPQCGLGMPNTQSECIRCGLTLTPPERPEVYPLTREAIVQLSIGGAMATGVFSVEFLTFLFTPLLTLVHELGHALTGWFFAYPSIPAFDFVYGGGVTMHSPRQTAILTLIYAIYVYGLLHFRKNPRALAALGSYIVLYSIAAFTSIHELLMIFMGHGAELIFAGIFLYRAISGSSIVHALERPVYAFAGFYILLYDLRFSYRLMTSADYRLEYGEAKGGGHWMDFSRISLEYMGGKLILLSLIFLLLTLSVPLVSYLFYRYRDYILNGAGWVFGESE